LRAGPFSLTLSRMARNGNTHVDDAKKVGQRIVHARGAISQKTLGEQVGVSAAHISRVENGERVPSLQLLERIAAALGVELAWLRGQPLSSDGRRPQIASAAIEAELQTIEAALARIRSQIRRKGGASRQPR
jgi:transcriptional regulator with XRE-family HTH domain